MSYKHAGAVEHKAAEKATKDDPHELQDRGYVTKVRRTVGKASEL